jgi:hypothetical protein
VTLSTEFEIRKALPPLIASMYLTHLLRESLAQALLIVIKNLAAVLGKALKDNVKLS